MEARVNRFAIAQQSIPIECHQALAIRVTQLERQHCHLEKLTLWFFSLGLGAATL